VDHPEAHELGALESRDQPEHPLLLAVLELCLETHEAVVVAGNVVLAELDDGVSLPAGARIDEANRLHRPETQRVRAAVGHHLDRQAPLEEHLAVEVVQGGRFGMTTPKNGVFRFVRRQFR
jgi:hypothetical protein